MSVSWSTQLRILAFFAYEPDQPRRQIRLRQQPRPRGLCGTGPGLRIHRRQFAALIRTVIRAVPRQMNAAPSGRRSQPIQEGIELTEVRAIVLRIDLPDERSEER